jgi:hypothetical protein
MKDRIRQHLLCPHTLLLYIGGSGGEFLSNNIVKYSPVAHSEPLKVVQEDNVNRTILVYPRFYEYLFRLPATRYITTEETVDFLAEHLTLEDVVAAERLWLTSNSNPFLRTHPVRGEVFDCYTTYTLLLDTEYWWDYSCALLTLKATYLPERIHQFYSWLSIRLDTEITVDIPALQQYLHNNNITRVSDLHLHAIGNPKFNNPQSPEVVFDLTIAELHQQYGSIRGDFLNNIQNQLRTRGHSTLLSMNRIITEPDYLASKFNITDPEFYNNIQTWHNKNLALLQANGFTRFVEPRP